MKLKSKQQEVKNQFLRIVKIAVGSTLSIGIAYSFGLNYSVAAGIITILTLQNTKKDTLIIAGKRVVAFLIAYSITYFLFSFFSFHLIGFGVFLFLFVGICVAFQMQDAIPINAVLVTHLLLEQDVSLKMFYNEFLLLLIGVGVGILFHLYIPSNVKIIRLKQRNIEEQMRKVFVHLAELLETTEKLQVRVEDINVLKKEIQLGINQSYQNMNNALFQETRYFIDYMEMRQKQYYILMDTMEKVSSLTMVTSQSIEIAHLMFAIADQLSESQNTRKLFLRQEALIEQFKQEELPKSREEFENRAILYIVAMNIRLLLRIKKEFVENLSEVQRCLYWDSIVQE